MYMRIRKAREDLGYTREKFAEKLDVSVSYLAELERGRTGISVKMLIKVCNVLGFVNFLFVLIPMVLCYVAYGKMKQQAP